MLAKFFPISKLGIRELCFLCINIAEERKRESVQGVYSWCLSLCNDIQSLQC